MERIMEDKFEVWSALSHDLPHVAIEEFERPLISLALWLVHRFDGIESWMVTPLVDEALNCILGPKQGLPVNEVVAFAVPWAHPLANQDVIVHEMSLINPGKSCLHPRIIKAVLRALDCVHI